MCVWSVLTALFVFGDSQLFPVHVINSLNASEVSIGSQNKFVYYIVDNQETVMVALAASQDMRYTNGQAISTNSLASSLYVRPCPIHAIEDYLLCSVRIVTGVGE